MVPIALNKLPPKTKNDVANEEMRKEKETMSCMRHGSNTTSKTLCEISSIKTLCEISSIKFKYEIVVFVLEE